MAVIKVKKIPYSRHTGLKDNINLLICKFCYYYPQYTYNEAMNMPLKLLKTHIKTVEREKALNYIELLKIARVSQAKSNSPANTLYNEYKRTAEGVRNG